MTILSLTKFDWHLNHTKYWAIRQIKQSIQEQYGRARGGGGGGDKMTMLMNITDIITDVTGPFLA